MNDAGTAPPGPTSVGQSLLASRRGRLISSLLDQAISSVSNFLLLLLVIRNESLAGVGAFGVVYLLFFTLLAAARSLTTEPLTIRWAGASASNRDRAACSAMGATLLLSACGAVLLAIASPLLDGSYRSTVLALALVLPALLLQDAWRLTFFAESRPERACLNDAVMLLAQIGLFFALTATGSANAVTLLTAWGVAAGCGFLAGLAQSDVRPAWRQSVGWLRETRDIGPALAADQLVTRGGEQLVLLLVAVTAGGAAAGVVTAGRTLFAPLTTLQSGVQAFSLPLLSRWSITGLRHRVEPFTWWSCGAMAIAFAGFGFVLAVAPDAVGDALFGGNWNAAQSVVPAMTFFSVANAVSYALWLSLRAIGAARVTFIVRLAALPVTVGAAAIGASTSNANGGIIGMGVGACFLAGAMILTLRLRLR